MPKMSLIACYQTKSEYKKHKIIYNNVNQTRSRFNNILFLELLNFYYAKNEFNCMLPNKNRIQKSCK
jgi:hypothetical protein